MWPSSSAPRHTPRELKIDPCKNLYTELPTVSVFIIAKKKKATQIPINRMDKINWDTHTMEFYLAIKGIKMIHATKWMDLDLMPKLKKLDQKAACYMILFPWNVQNRQISRGRSGLVICRWGGSRGVGFFQCVQGLFWGWWKCSRISGDDYTTLSVLKTLICPSKGEFCGKWIILTKCVVLMTLVNAGGQAGAIGPGFKMTGPWKEEPGAVEGPFRRQDLMMRWQEDLVPASWQGRHGSNKLSQSHQAVSSWIYLLVFNLCFIRKCFLVVFPHCKMRRV